MKVPPPEWWLRKNYERRSVDKASLSLPQEKRVERGRISADKPGSRAARFAIGGRGNIDRKTTA